MSLHCAAAKAVPDAGGGGAVVGVGDLAAVAAVVVVGDGHWVGCPRDGAGLWVTWVPL